MTSKKEAKSDSEMKGSADPGELPKKEGAPEEEVSKEKSREEHNFTWANFFEKKCGILKSDALIYESSLIAHRMSPEDTLCESLDLIMSVGKIPLGDKLKIKKVVQRQEEAIVKSARELNKAQEELGLGKYNSMEARIILDLGGGTTKDHIDYGIEQWEDTQSELGRLCAIGRVKAGTGALRSRDAPNFDDIPVLAAKVHDPAMQLLNSFGYTTWRANQVNDVILSGLIEQDNHDDEQNLTMYS